MLDNLAMKPAYKITVNGSDITALVADRLVSLTITDQAGVNSDRVEVVLDDRDERLSIPPARATMDVEIGYAGQLVPKGSFTIEDIEVSGPLRTMTLRGTAIGASKGAGASREKSWHDTTLGDIAKSIASRHGWAAAINAELAAVKIDHADQHENDLQFLSRLAAENGAVAKVSAKRLVVAAHGEGKRVSGKPMPSITITAKDVADWSMTLAARGDYTGVKAHHHDPVTGQRGTEIEGEDGVNAHSLPHAFASVDAAKSAAKARMQSLKRGKSSLQISTMPGNPALTAESLAQLTGFRAGVDGTWLVNVVTHKLTDSGYTCNIQCETPGTSKGSGTA
jgi:phage protein D